MTSNRPIINDWEFKGQKVRFHFYDGDDTEEFKPYTQSYAIPFTEDGKIVIGRHDADYDDWHTPGGKIERGEHPDDAMIRELDEELSLEVLKFKLVGAQLVEYINSDKPSHYQLRYVASVRLKTLTPDPDGKGLWERKLVDPEEFERFVKWGDIGKHLLKRGREQYLKWKQK